MNLPPGPPCGAPETGPLAHDLSRELEVRQTVSDRRYPVSGPPSSPSGMNEQDNGVKRKPKSVTDVLNHECYLCIDCALLLSTLNLQLSTVFASCTQSGVKTKSCCFHASEIAWYSYPHAHAKAPRRIAGHNEA